jgi:hypothetical protein
MRAMARPIPEEPPVTSALGIRTTLKESWARARIERRKTFLSPGDGGPLAAVAV